MTLPLEQYGMIGDCQTAALVGRNGSIDWLCFPWFDSAACFAAVLGTPDNGRWLLAPVDSSTSARWNYRDDTLILETHYTSAEGEATVVDCMPPRSKEPDLIRMVVGRRGRVRMRMDLKIRFDYGSVVPWVQHIDDGIKATAGPDTLLLRTPIEVRGEDLSTTAEFVVEAGEQIPLILTWHASHLPSPKPSDATEGIRFTEVWWKDWSRRCTYEGPWRDAVMARR